MVHKRTPSQEPILPLEGAPPPEEPKVSPDWHTFQFYENPYLSGVYGAVGGILAGGALLGILWYFYGIAFLLSVYIAGPISAVLLIGMILSVACRCIVCILVPEILGKYGRWILYTLLLAALVRGPVANISTNMERMSNSMGCSAEMIKNQTQDLKQQFLDPFNNIKNQMLQIEAKVKQYAGYIESAMKPITDAIKATASGLSSAANYLKKAADECKSMFNNAYNSCRKFFSNAYSKCKSTVDKIPVIGSLRRKRGTQGEVISEEVFVQWNDKEEEKHKRFWETRAEEILEETLHEANLHPQHRLYDHAAIKEKYYNLTIRRFRRGVVSGICEVVNIGSGLCAPLKITTGICTPLETLSDGLEYIGKGVDYLYQAIKNAFYFNIIKKWYLIGLSDVSKTAAALVAEIASWFSFHAYIIHTSLSILTQWTSLLLLFMFLQSALYLQHYLSQIDYDNNYISLNFRRYDRDCRRLGKPSVLPFKKNEASQYIFTSTLALSGSEIKKSILAILQLLLNIIFYAVVVFIDYAIYYAVYLVHTYANIQIDYSGSMYINFQITGDGMIARFLRSLVTGITLQDSYYTTYNITQCLPYPSYPDNNNHYLLLSLTGGVLVTIILQSYCYRIKRALCGFFYQQREEERIVYLHNKILHHRKFKLQQMRSRLKDSNQARDAERALAKLPLIGGFFGGHDPGRSCLHCGISDKDVEHFYTCPRVSCYADYCEDCFNEMGRKCLLCSQKEEIPSQEGTTDKVTGEGSTEGEVEHSWISTNPTDTLPLLQDSHQEQTEGQNHHMEPSDEEQVNHNKPSHEREDNHEKTSDEKSSKERQEEPSTLGQDNPAFSGALEALHNPNVTSMLGVIKGNLVPSLGESASILKKIPSSAVSLAVESLSETPGLSPGSPSDGRPTDTHTKSTPTGETTPSPNQTDPNSMSTHGETTV